MNMTNQRREERYELRQEVTVAMRLLPAEDAAPRLIRGVAVDLSKRGLKARLRESLPIGQKMDLEIHFPSLAFVLETPGAVCWARPAEDNLCWTGITIDKEIPPEIWLELSSHGFIDRRQHPRSPITHSALIRRELAGDLVAVDLLDLSHGGCRFRSSHALQEGERVLLSLHPEDTRELSVMARVAWVCTTGGEHLIGCEFSGRDAFAKFRDRLREAMGGLWPEAPNTSLGNRRSRTAIALLAGVASFATLALWWHYFQLNVRG